MSRAVGSRRVRLVALVLVCCAVMLATEGMAGAGGGNVLPVPARPQGYSLSAMTGATAQFSTSSNNPAFYPQTPFQVLYADPSTFGFNPDGCGLVLTGTNTLTVAPGKTFFVPVFNVDDSPPVLGTFPTTSAGAQSYFFDPSQLGGRDFAISIDGTVTPLGHGYLSGPVNTPPLPDGGGTHIITLGAFVAPMTRGAHTVTLTGGLFGALIPANFGGACSLSIDYHYTVNVT